MKAIVSILCVGAFLIPLGGCEHVVHEETKLSQNKIRVQQDNVFEDIAAADLDGDRVATLAQHYKSSGNSDIAISVTYDPKSRHHGAMHATNEAARIAQAFNANGVSSVEANIIPVANVIEPRALVSYSALSAKPPEDCDLMPGLTHNNIDTDAGYKIGCSINTLVARQVARPKDLGGRDVTHASSDGRRASNVLESYRAGIPNEALEGESASE